MSLTKNTTRGHYLYHQTDTFPIITWSRQQVKQHHTIWSLQTLSGDYLSHKLAPHNITTCINVVILSLIFCTSLPCASLRQSAMIVWPSAYIYKNWVHRVTSSHWRYVHHSVLSNNWVHRVTSSQHLKEFSTSGHLKYLHRNTDIDYSLSVDHLIYVLR